MAGEKAGTPVEIALQYNSTYNENVHSYVNNINTIEGGTHVAGFRRGLTRTLKNYAEKSGLLKNSKVEITGDDFRERSEEHTSELQSLMRISYAVFCLKKKKTKQNN